MGLAVRLAVLRAAWVIGVLGAVADGTARGAAGRAAGRAAGGMAGGMAGYVAGGMAGIRLAAAHTDINDLVVGVPHLAQRLGCAQRLDD